MSQEQPLGRPKPRRRGPGRPFVKGQSGNPKGRARVAADIRELARQYGPEAVRTLAGIMQTGSERGRVMAAEALLDRGYGRPGQSVELSGPQGGPVEQVVFYLPRNGREGEGPPK